MFAANLPLSVPSCRPVCFAEPAQTAWQPAGIDDQRFICLTGRSGRRYMFCRIGRNRASLHADCLFAVTACNGEIECISPHLPDALSRDAQIHVHLPDDAPLDAALADLT